MLLDDRATLANVALLDSLSTALPLSKRIASGSVTVTERAGLGHVQGRGRNFSLAPVWPMGRPVRPGWAGRRSLGELIAELGILGLRRAKLLRKRLIVSLGFLQTVIQGQIVLLQLVCFAAGHQRRETNTPATTCTLHQFLATMISSPFAGRRVPRTGLIVNCRS